MLENTLVFRGVQHALATFNTPQSKAAKTRAEAQTNYVVVVKFLRS